MKNQIYRIKITPFNGKIDGLELFNRDIESRKLETISGLTCLVEEQSENISIRDERVAAVREGIYGALEILKDYTAHAYLNFGEQKHGH